MPAAMEGTGETDSVLEGRRFEPPVPPEDGAFQNSILSTLVLAGRRSARLTHPPRARPQLASQEAAEDAGRGGLPKVERAAARIFRLAADQGDAAAQAKLGVRNRVEVASWAWRAGLVDEP